VGKAMGDVIEKAQKRVVEAINIVLEEAVPSSVMILLENTAGQGTEIGYKFEHLRDIIAKIKNKKKIGVCLDSAHLFEAGYDLRDKSLIHKTFSEFDKIVGLSYLKVIHYNDSLTEFNSHVDRHENIGKGKIGMKGMKDLINYKPLIHLPFIMETPKKKKNDDIRNMQTLKSYIK